MDKTPPRPTEEPQSEEMEVQEKAPETKPPVVPEELDHPDGELILDPIPLPEEQSSDKNQDQEKAPETNPTVMPEELDFDPETEIIRNPGPLTEEQVSTKDTPTEAAQAEPPVGVTPPTEGDESSEEQLAVELTEVEQLPPGAQPEDMTEGPKVAPPGYPDSGAPVDTPEQIPTAAPVTPTVGAPGDPATTEDVSNRKAAQKLMTRLATGVAGVEDSAKAGAKAALEAFLTHVANQYAKSSPDDAGVTLDFQLAVEEASKEMQQPGGSPEPSKDIVSEKAQRLLEERLQQSKDLVEAAVPRNEYIVKPLVKFLDDLTDEKKTRAAQDLVDALKQIVRQDLVRIETLRERIAEDGQKLDALYNEYEALRKLNAELIQATKELFLMAAEESESLATFKESNAALMEALEEDEKTWLDGALESAKMSFDIIAREQATWQEFEAVEKDELKTQPELPKDKVISDQKVKERNRELEAIGKENFMSVRMWEDRVQKARKALFNRLRTSFIAPVNFLEQGRETTADKYAALIEKYPDHSEALQRLQALYEESIDKIEMIFKPHNIHPIVPEPGAKWDFTEHNALAKEANPNPDLPRESVSRCIGRGYFIQSGSEAQAKSVIEKAKVALIA